MRSWMGALIVALIASSAARAQEEGGGAPNVAPQRRSESAPGAPQANQDPSSDDGNVPPALGDEGNLEDDGEPRSNQEVLEELAKAPPAPSPRRRELLSDDTPVKLPWSEVAKLLEAARRARPERAPIPFALGPARVVGEADARTLVLRVDVPVQLSDDGWNAIPLWRSAAAVRRATLDGRPAALSEVGGAAVLVARGAGVHLLQAELVLALGGSGDRAQLGFATPVAASWRLRLPGKAARVEPAVDQRFRPDGPGVILEATTAPTGALSIDWTGVRVGARPSRVSAESFTYVVYREDSTFGRSVFEFQITGGGRETLSVGVPAEMEVVSAEAKDLAHWTVEGDGAEKRLVVTFVRAQRGRVSLRLAFELPKPAELAELPVLAAQEVDEQRAWLAASSESPVSISQERMEGGEAVDAKHLPPHLLSRVDLPFALAWRHQGPGFTGRVRIAHHATVSLPQATIDAAYYTTVLTEEGQEVVKATFLVKNNLKPYLAVTLPRGARLAATFVSGESVNPSRGKSAGEDATDEGVVLLPLVKSRELGTGETLANHQVEAGWSLSDLALTYYHDASKWQRIAEFNRDVLGPSGEPQVGQTVVIPRLAPGPGVSDLETAFPVEIVYSRENRAAGLLGSVTLEVPATDLGVMSAVWTVYLPSRIDPLHFSGNLVQTSYVRYGVLRRLRTILGAGLLRLDPPPLAPEAVAGERYLSKRFSFSGEADEAESARSRPRVSLPLVGRAYVFKRNLLEGDQPALVATFLDRRVERPFRLAVLGLGFALALWVAGVWRARPSLLPTLGAVLAFAGLAMGAGHFVLGTHRHALAGIVLGSWFALAIALQRLPAEGDRVRRAWQRVVRWGTPATLFLVVLAGLNWVTAFLGLVFAVFAAMQLWRARTGATAGALPTALAVLLALASPAGASAAQLPPGAEVTIPFSALRGLVGEEARPLPPPRPFTVLSAEYRGALQGERIAIDARVAAEVHAEGWVALPLVASEHALSQVRVDGKPASTAVIDGQYVLPLRGTGVHQIELALLVKAEPGLARLALVPGVAGRLSMQFPAARMQPELTPASEVRIEGAVLRALLPADGRAELYWSAAAPERGRAAAPGEVRTVARTLQIVSADERRVRVFAAVRYLMQRGSSNRFAVRLPDGVELLDVQGEGLAEHEVVSEEGRSVLRVTTASLVRDAFELSFAYDWKAPVDGGILPVFEVLDVRSETGALGIESAGSLELKLAKVDGAATIDVRSAPELLEHTDKPVLHAVRYLQHPYTVQVAFERHPEKELDPATIDQASYTTVLARDGRAMTRGVFRVRNARQPFLAIDLPVTKGLESELQSVIVGGEPAKPVRDAKGRLLLPLMRSPSAEREMRAFEVEMVYLTRIAGMGRSGTVPALLPSVDLAVSEVEWSLYLPPGSRVSSRQRTEESADHMQWATAPRALWAMPMVARNAGEAIASGGILPVRFNLPEQGTPETFWRHYLPAGRQPVFRVEYAPRSTRAALQVVVALGFLGLGAAGIWFLRRKTA